MMANFALKTLPTPPFRRVRALSCRHLAVLLSALPALTHAQGGPPMVTDDPDTPGDGRWEINIASIGSHTPGRFDLTAPDADINYGWGDHVQLNLDIAWDLANERDNGWTSGLSEARFGVKWRFLDREQAGVSLSTYPQLLQNILGASVRRGLATPGKQFYLPVQISGDAGEFGLDGEIGHTFVQSGPDQWAAGFIVAHDCGAGFYCRLEIRETRVPHDSQTLVNFGWTHKLTESLNFLGAVGRDLGPATADRQSVLFYLGVQIVR